MPIPTSGAHICATPAAAANLVTECYYLTLKQCRDTISGVGGTCEPNPFYDGRPVVDEYSQPRRARPPYKSR